MEDYNFKIANEKTKYVTIKYQTINNYKKLGTILDDEADIISRVSQAENAFMSLKYIWRNKHLTEKTKLKLYQALIKPILTYNMSTNGSTNTVLKPLASKYNNHLRYIFGINQQNDHVTLLDLHRRGNTKCILHEITKQRFSFLGHILRRDENVPANIVMKNYFLNPDNYRATINTKSNLAKVIKTEIELYSFIIPDYGTALHLNNFNDFYRLQELSQDQEKWKKFVNIILKSKYPEYY